MNGNGHGHKRILVAGGTGMLGRPVALALLREGYRVRVLTQDPAKAGSLFGDPVEIVEGDVTRPETLDAAVEGCQGLHISLHGRAGRENFHRVEFEGTRNLAAAAEAAGVQRITYLSGATVSDDPGVYFNRAKRKGEQALLEGGVPTVILRASWFMETLPMMVRDGAALLVGRANLPTHFIAGQDFVRMVVAAHRLPLEQHRVVYAYGPEAVGLNDAILRFKEEAFPEAKVQRVSLPMFWIVSRFAGERVRFAYDMMRHFNRRAEPSEVDRGEDLFGPSEVTLERWTARYVEVMRNQSPEGTGQ